MLSPQSKMYPLGEAVLFYLGYTTAPTLEKSTQSKGRTIMPRVLSHLGYLTICQTTVWTQGVCVCMYFKKYKEFCYSNIQVGRTTECLSFLEIRTNFWKICFSRSLEFLFLTYRRDVNIYVYSGTSYNNRCLTLITPVINSQEASCF